MKTLEFIKTKGSVGLFVCFLALLSNPISAFAEEYLNEATQDAPGASFTMRVCGTLEKADSESGKMRTFFVQNGETDDALMAEIDALVANALPAAYREMASASDSQSIEDLIEWIVPSIDEEEDLDPRA